MKTQYITDGKGKVNAVIVPKGEYDRMKAIAEEYADIQAFDNVMGKIKKGEEQFVSFEEVLKTMNK